LQNRTTAGRKSGNNTGLTLRGRTGIVSAMASIVAAAPQRKRDYLARAAAFEGFEPLCTEHGLDGAALLRQAGLDPNVLADADAMIPYRACLRALDLAARAARLPHIGLLLADKQGLSMLGPVGFLVAEAPVLRAAIAQLGAYIHLHNQGMALRLDIANGLALWSFETLLGESAGLAFADDHALATGVTIIRQLLGRNWNPDHVTIQHAAPRDAAPYRRAFCCPVEFAAERNLIGFDARLLDQPLPGHDARLHAVLDGYIRHLDASNAPELDKQIQLVLLQAMKQGSCSLPRVAARMAMTPRSLQRRLAGAGTSFQAELDGVRNNVARRYLTETRMPLTAISPLLGYSDLAAFSRAFKRINGMAPQAWRARQKWRPGGNAGSGRGATERPGGEQASPPAPESLFR
jgi:AraC-like DNA-binding protein